MSIVSFTINGKTYSITSLEADTSLNTYIRNHVNLRGTKVMCQEGGCGACVVAATIQHPVTKKQETIAVNSCLVSVFSCHKWDITTIEGIGDKSKGYHAIQERLATFNGSQCGYCSPGFVMNMYCLQEAHPELTMKEIENSFASNMCRCTGYRPIADAFKSFAKDADQSLKDKIRDIEDLSLITFCKKTGSVCTKKCDDYSEDEDMCKIGVDETRKLSNHYYMAEEPVCVTADNLKWYKVYTVKNILAIFNKEGIDSYRLVAGNTAQGVYDFQERVSNAPKMMIDITSVAELRKFSVEENIELGANMTLTEIMDSFVELSKSNVYFSYLSKMYDHMDLIAHIPIRNIGTVGGNLSIKQQNNEFPSDMFLIFETVRGRIKIVDRDEKYSILTLPEYLKADMHGKIVYSILLPPLSQNHKYRSYKIMKRAQHAHAMVNAGFLMEINKNKVVSASIVYGCISEHFIHAMQTEKLITGKDIFTETVLSQAIQSLNNELKPDHAPPEPSPDYRKKLAIGLFYKYILDICPKDILDPRFVSGGIIFDRPTSSGKQEFPTNKEVWPIGQPIPKIEALAQTSGEAVYCNDMPTLPNELYAAFVLATEMGGEIDKIDGEEALKIKGVVALFTASDVPGKNTFTPLPSPFLVDEEEIFCSGKIKFHGQPVGIILAETDKLAHTAALQVKVTYKNKNSKPIVYMRDVIGNKEQEARIVNGATEKAKSKGDDVKKVIKGSLDVQSQYHYSMETQTTVCVPVEDGLDVYPATQCPAWIQEAIAGVLNIPESSINLSVRRLGGSYGAKITRSTHVATACALAAYKLNRPVRFVMSIEQNMKCMGKRLACCCDYEVGVNDKGKIQYLNHTSYEDSGNSLNETFIVMHEGNKTFGAAYNKDTWNVSINAVITDTPSHTWCRAPGTTEALAMGETIMEHIAVETGKDPIDIRLANMNLTDNPLPDMIKYFITKTEYREREKSIGEFNKQNRWRKRGINFLPMKYFLDYFGNYAVHVSVYVDGSVAVAHGGIEMGQGINTKVAQVTAHTLNVPMEKVYVKATNTFITPNTLVTGGSQASELCCLSVKRACERILERLEPIKNEMTNPSWEELVAKAAASNINLAENYLASDDDRKSYVIWGTAVTEVEIDVLTGIHVILRVDILEDVGESLSPDVDLGQIEGAFTMGIGYWTCESIEYDRITGALLTNRTWTYKVPGIKDIPIDFRVEFKKDSPNKLGVLRSKATGEPSMLLAYSVVLAIRRAITAARADNGLPADKWFHLDMPASPESILMAIDTKLDAYKFK